ncbi:hypothetical protein FB157_13199 [Streptomyces sp. BK340]|nr:hypothetical protein FB157_13199 [Streptomyces sp. BK340]
MNVRPGLDRAASVSPSGGNPVCGRTSAGRRVLCLGGAVGSLLGGAPAGRWGRVTAARRSYLVSVAAVAGVVFVPGPALYLFVALTSAGLYVPFSLQVTLGQDCLPSREGTAGGITLGLTAASAVRPALSSATSPTRPPCGPRWHP